MEQPKKLYRSRTDKIIAGVCGGLGEYFAMDPIIFRIIFLVLLFAGGSGFALYIILAIIIPKEPLAGHAAASGVDPKAQFNDFVTDVRDSAQHWAAQARGEVTVVDHEHRHHSRRAWFGVVVVALGVLLLINQLFPQYWFRWDILWPIAIIVVGVAILSRGQHHS